LSRCTRERRLRRVFHLQLDSASNLFTSELSGYDKSKIDASRDPATGYTSPVEHDPTVHRFGAVRGKAM
jgi:hypothetical protein